MQLTWHGHSTWHVEVGDTTFLIDPLFDNPKTDMEPSDVDDPDYLLLTHGHADHIADAGAFADSAVVVSSPEIAGFVEEEHADAGGEPVDETGEEAVTDADDVEEPETPDADDDGDSDDDSPDTGEEDVETDGGTAVDTIGMNLGGTVEAGDAYVTMHKAEHTNGINTEYGQDAGIPAGFIISTDEPAQSSDQESTTFYHAGDTALFTEMRDVIASFLEPDAAAVPIGDHFTMGPQQAAIAVDWLDVDYAYPMHYDTFPPIEQDPEEFQREVRATGARTDVVIPEADEPFPL
jgi:L-ascorbate metabolism protein UlaG (beta-lactamase superfamily)